MSKKIHILIADDHQIVREGIVALLEEEADIEVVGQASDGNQAVLLAKTLKPDIILLDMVMPRKDGLEAIRQIMVDNSQSRILVLTSFSEDEKVVTAIREGAMGYLLKEASAQELLYAIRTIYEGETFLPPVIARKLIKEISQPREIVQMKPSLTDREKEVLQLIAQGLSNKDISTQLAISERTVNGHVGNILRKLNLTNRTQAALYILNEKLNL